MSDFSHYSFFLVRSCFYRVLFLFFLFVSFHFIWFCFILFVWCAGGTTPFKNILIQFSWAHLFLLLLLLCACVFNVLKEKTLQTNVGFLSSIFSVYLCLSSQENLPTEKKLVTPSVQWKRQSFSTRKKWFMPWETFDWKIKMKMTHKVADDGLLLLGFRPK